MRGASERTGSVSWVERRSWARRKERSSWRKAWVKTVEVVGVSGGDAKAVGLKRRK